MPRKELMDARYQHYAFTLDPLSEKVRSLSDIARIVGISGKVLRDCARRGRRTPGGEWVRLEVCLLPGGLGTSEEACLRFLRRLNGVSAPTVTALPPRLQPGY